MSFDQKRYFRLYAKPQFLLVTSAKGNKKSLIQQTKIRVKTPEGELSLNAQRKIKTAIRWLIACADWKTVYEKKYKKTMKWKINMATLTFHENLTDDNLARKILSMWLETAKYRWDIQQYIWKAEPQARGAIHFHCSFNKYIPHTELKFTWNRLLKKFGLNNINDNSTDIHAVVNIKNHENYLSEYFLNEKKHEGRRKIKGRLWGCSHGLSQAGKEFILIDEIEANEMQKEDWNISLYKKYSDSERPIPDFLKFTDIYLTGEQYYRNLPNCPLKELYYSELRKLKQNKKQLEFWKSD